MTLRPSALTISHRQSRRLGLARSDVQLRRWRSLLYGTDLRKLRRPLLALEVAQEMGPCRHAVAQRHVAGFMSVHFPPPPSNTARPGLPTFKPEDRHA